MTKEAANRSIPSLDGLRALSVLAVILGHTQSKFLDAIPHNIWFRDGERGVDVFFVISGFLITHLLLKELDHTGAINLPRFYFRRTFRIFPPFYVYLGCIAILMLGHLVPAGWKQWWVSALYLQNYWRLPQVWTLDHTWSLALEEQFYLLWPLLIKKFSRRTNLRIALWIVMISPLIRIVTMLLWPQARVGSMFHTHLDPIMTGCLLSLALETGSHAWFKKVATNPWVAAAACAFVLTMHRKGWYSPSVGVTLYDLSIALVLVFGVFRHESWLGKFLNVAPLRHLGRISYSLYLWNMLFTRNGPFSVAFPLNIVCIIACAELSYFLVEVPSFKARDLLQSRLPWLASAARLRLYHRPSQAPAFESSAVLIREQPGLSENS